MLTFKVMKLAAYFARKLSTLVEFLFNFFMAATLFLVISTVNLERKVKICLKRMILDNSKTPALIYRAEMWSVHNKLASNRHEQACCANKQEQSNDQYNAK